MKRTTTQIDAEIAALYEEKEQLKSRRMWQCGACTKLQSIRKTMVVCDMFYISPHGCSGGDYWKNSHDYNLYCNKCDSWTRTYVPSEYGTSTKESKKKYPFPHKVKDNIEFFGEVLYNYPRDGVDQTIVQMRQQAKEKADRNYE